MRLNKKNNEAARKMCIFASAAGTLIPVCACNLFTRQQSALFTVPSDQWRLLLIAIKYWYGIYLHKLAETSWRSWCISWVATPPMIVEGEHFPTHGWTPLFLSSPTSVTKRNAQRGYIHPKRGLSSQYKWKHLCEVQPQLNKWKRLGGGSRNWTNRGNGIG